MRRISELKSCESVGGRAVFDSRRRPLSQFSRLKIRGLSSFFVVREVPKLRKVPSGCCLNYPAFLRKGFVVAVSLIKALLLFSLGIQET